MRSAETDADILALYPLIKQLRPQLQSPESFLAIVGTQRLESYRILSAWQDDVPCGFAGYRLLHNLVHGRFLYVDDLVTSQDARSGGVGAALLAELKTIARDAKCQRLVLDTGMDNALAQRFYFRNGLLARGLHFAIGL
jgi:ribosomal protein S18 acetylase RimI-like enzyme